jgi:hypothetical protein
MTFDWKSLIGVIEMAGNLALSILIPGGAAFAPLLANLESALNPLLMSIGTGASVQTEIMVVYGTMIGILNILKQQPNLDPALLAKIQGYLTAAENATSAEIAASKGFDPSQFQPVTPIA